PEDAEEDEHEADPEHEVGDDNDNSDLDPAFLKKWLQRQKTACSRLLAGEKPVLPPKTPGSDPHKDRLIGLQEQYRFVRSTVSQTLVHGVSNSIALLGEPGSGKHSLLEATLDSVAEELELAKASKTKAGSKKRKSVVESSQPPYYHVRIDGSLQPDDRLCLRALAKQLVEQGAFERSAVLGVMEQDQDDEEDNDHEEEEEEEEGDPLLVDEQADSSEEESDDSGSASGESDNVLGPKVSNSGAKSKNAKKHKDTAVDEQERLQVQQALFASITSATNLIISLLSTPMSADGHDEPVLSKPLIVSLSNFQNIVTREPQAFLYCLLDAVQASSYAPGLLIVGFSNILDVPDRMEKRVKSRFSHRIAHVYPLDNVPAPTARTIKMTKEKGKNKGSGEDSAGGKGTEMVERPTVLDIVKSTLMARVPRHKADTNKDHSIWGEYWSTAVDTLLDDASFRIALRELWDRINNVKMLQRVLRPVIANLHASGSPILDPAAVRRSFAEQRMSATESVVRGLTMPELTLLITARHIHNRGRIWFNFEMCWDELRRWLGVQAEFEKGHSTNRSAEDQDQDTGPSPYRFRMRQVGQIGGDRHNGSRTDRNKAKMAFKNLLELELFMPDASFSTLNMTSLAGGLGGLSATRKGSLLRDELVPVRCQIEVGNIVKLVEEMVEKGEGDVGADRRLLNWAKGSGL
ncbi:hypothetical protein CF335_g8582, partial [Tilletia laevis]